MVPFCVKAQQKRFFYPCFINNTNKTIFFKNGYIEKVLKEKLLTLSLTNNFERFKGQTLSPV